MPYQPLFLSFALLLSACAAGPLAPTGPLGVGTTTWVMEHPTSLEDPLPPEDGPRRVPVQAWYPTQDAAPGELRKDAALFGTEAPVLLFLHGGGWERAMHASLFEELASHGVVSIAADHPGVARKARFPEGRAVGLYEDFVEMMDSGNTLISAAQPLFGEVVALMRADAALALDGLPAPLSGLNTSALAVGGHSLGASVALDFCREDARCKVYVNLDGPPLIDQGGVNEAGEAILEAQGLDVPARIVSTGLYAEDVPGAAAAWEALDAQAKRIDAPVLHWHLAEAGHLDVTDVPLIMPTWLARKLFGASSMGREDPEETVGAAHDAIAVFLRHALLCDAEAAPEAVGERWPLLALRHTHADRRAVSADVCP